MAKPPSTPTTAPRPMCSDEADDEVDDQDLGCRIGAARDHLDQRDGEEDGDRIVGAGFDFEDRADAVAQIDVAGAQQEEHRRRVGRGDGGAEQQAIPAR